MRGRALVTTVLDNIATNIARRSPLRASSTSRWVMATGAAGVGAEGVKEAAFDD